MHRSLTVYLPALIAAVFLAACASKPIVDTHNVDMVQYEKDLADCEHIAEQVATGEITAKSAAFGAGVGAAYGVIGGGVEPPIYSERSRLRFKMFRFKARIARNS